MPSATTTLTLELPADLAERLAETMKPEDIHAFAVAAIADALESDVDEEMQDALREYAEDRAAGRFYPIEHLDTRIETFLQERRAQREREKQASETAA